MRISLLLMRCAFILYIFLLAFSAANSRQNIIQPQDIAEPKEDTTEFEPFGCILEVDAIVPKNWKSYLEKNIQPDSLLIATVPAGCYRIDAAFVINVDGKIADVVIKNDPGNGLGQWVKKGIEGYKGKWIPAQRNGQSVKSYRVQPILIFIEEDEEKKCADPLPGKLIL
jgi:hypothetical protein